MRKTIMEVDTEIFNRNIDLIKEYVGNKNIMPVIKANAYGTYINKRIDIINKFDIVAVALVDEAVELRRLGYQKNIFVLNQPSIDEIQEIIKYNITIGLSSEEFLNKILNINKEINVHLEIETGMNRTGIQLGKLKYFIKKIKQAPNIKVEGVYTHLSSADYDVNYTNYQLNTFKEAVKIVKESFDNIIYIHSSASNGLLNCKDKISNLVRPGIIIYGYESFENMKAKINVEPICKLKTNIIFIKEIKKGEAIGYSKKFISKEKMKIATIPIGYADGFRRCLSNIGEVVIRGKRAKIIGNICMDSCMIDVTNIKNAKVGDEVYIWDNKSITVDEIAKKCNTINYEIISTISDRVPRVFIK